MKRQIKYSILESATVSEGVSFRETFESTLALAKVAEDSGYERFWFAEHHNSNTIASSAPAVLIGHVAENTRRIRVGAGGVMLPNHSPLIVAEQFATLAQLYPGRIDLGVGRAPGTDPATARAIRSDFFQAAHAFPDEIQKIQTYFSPSNKAAKLRVPMAEGLDVAMYILGSSVDSARLAAKKGLPYAFASHFAPMNLEEALRIYKHEFRPSEFLYTPYVIAGINVIVADTDEEAVRLSTSLIKILSGMSAGVMETVKPPMEMTSELVQVLQQPQINQMLRYLFVGSKETVRSRVENFAKEADVDEIIAVSTMYATEDRIRSAQLLAEVMKEINANSAPSTCSATASFP